MTSLSLCVFCLWDATYTLADGVLYVCGNNEGECMCVDREADFILEPTVVNCGGRSYVRFDL